MNNEAGLPPVPRQNKPWVIVIVVVVVLCCLCLGVIGLLIAFYQPILQTLGLQSFLPLLTTLA